MRTILCFGDSNTWGCAPLTAPEPPRRYEPWPRWPGVLRRELGDGYCIVEEGLLVCPAPVGRLELFAEEFAGAVEKSRGLARQYAAVAAARSCPSSTPAPTCGRATSTASTWTPRRTNGSAW